MVILLKNAYRGSVFEVSTTVHPDCSPSTQDLPAGTDSSACVKDQVGFGGAVVWKSLLKLNGGSSSDDIEKGWSGRREWGFAIGSLSPIQPDEVVIGSDDTDSTRRCVYPVDSRL